MNIYIVYYGETNEDNFVELVKAFTSYEDAKNHIGKIINNYDNGYLSIQELELEVDYADFRRFLS